MPFQESLVLLDALDQLQRKDASARYEHHILACHHLTNAFYSWYVLQIIAELRRTYKLNVAAYKRWDAATHERHDARSRSCKALQDSVYESESRSLLLTAEVGRQEHTMHLAWFKKLEDEIQ
jgi:hypothetical protein